MTPAAFIGRQRVAARLAWREARRSPWRTLLVCLLIAVPVAGMTVADVVVRTSDTPFDLEDRGAFGLADLAVHVPPPPSEADLARQRDLPAEAVGPVAPVAPGVPGAAGEAVPPTSPTVAEVLASVQKAVPGATTYVLQQANGALFAPGNERREVKVSAATGEPAVNARYGVRDGRLPTPGSADEVALSPTLAKALHVKVGQQVAIDAIGMKATVTGIAYQLAAARDDLIVAGSFPRLAPEQVQPVVLVDLPGAPTVRTVSAIRATFANSTAYVELGHPSQRLFDTAVSTGQTRAVRWAAVAGAISLAVVGIVIAAAFAVGARRQLRTLGLLATNGAPPKTVRSMLLWQGAWSGLLGSIVGLGLGAVGIAVLWPHRSRVLTYEPSRPVVRFSDLIPAVILGVVAAVAASFQPARSASRVSTLSALAGRRPLAAVPRKVVVGGVVAMAVGLGCFALATIGSQGDSAGHENVWAGLAILGGLGVLFGSSAIAPALVSRLDAFARRTQGAGRLALRSLARQRARAGAVVAAVCAAGALAVAAATVAATEEVRPSTYLPTSVVAVSKFSYGDVGPELTGADGKVVEDVPAPPPVTDTDLAPILAVLPGAAIVDITDKEGAVEATPAVLDLAGVPDEGREALRTVGGIELFNPREENGRFFEAPVTFAPDGTLVFGSESKVERYGFEPTRVPTRYAAFTGRVLMRPDLFAARTGKAVVEQTLVVAEEPLDGAQRRRLRDVQQSAYGTFGLLRLEGAAAPDRPGAAQLSISFEDGDSAVPATLIMLVLDGVALVFTGFVVAIGLALAAAETRDERQVLTAVGARPSSLRRLAAYKAAALSGLGLVLAVPTGLLPVWVVIQSADGHRNTKIPWLALVLTVFAVPALLSGITLAGSGALLRLRPVRASTWRDD